MTRTEGAARARSIATAADFAEALAALRLRAGMSVREVSRAAGIPSATLGGYFSGRHLPSATQPDVLARLLTALGVEEAEQPAWHDALRRVRRSPGRRTPTEPPYRGLAKFDVEQAHLYFGREQLTDELCRLVELAGASRSLPHFVAVVAPSGAGKSSLVRAGLLGRRRAAGCMGDVLVEGASNALDQPGADQPGADQPAVVVVDQFEEVLRPSVGAGEREAFLRWLAELADPAGNTVVVVTLRADYFAAALAEPALLPLLGAYQLLVGPMTRDELTRAVVEPARVVGTEVEPALVDVVWREIEESGVAVEQAVLPLLSHALLEGWRRSGGGRLGVQEYLAVGGLAGAVTRTAEDVVSGLSPSGLDAARRLFGQLIDVVDDGRASRRTLRPDEVAALPEDVRSLAERFVAARILTATASSLEISHDAVLQVWPRLQEWIEDDRDLLRLRRRLRVASELWLEHDEDEAFLARGVLLTQGHRLLEVTRMAVMPGVVRYLEVSAEHARREGVTERRRRLTTRALFAAVLVLALIASGLSLYLAHTASTAQQERADAQHALDTALSRQVALEADQLRATAPALANQLAVAAYRIAPTVDARSSIFGSSERPASTRLAGVTGTMSASASPDGHLIAVSAADGSVTLWRRTAPEVAPTRLARLETGTPTPLYAGAFSTDGRLYFTGGQGRLVAMDVSNPAHPRLWPHALNGVNTTVQALAVRGDVLYAGTSDPSLLRWRITAAGATPLPAVHGFGGEVRGVAVAPDGTVATASLDGILRLWRPRGDRLRQTWQRHVASAGRPIYATAFSPDGRLLVDTGAEGHADVWRRTGSSAVHLHRLGGFKSYVNGAAFSHDGTMLALAASGNVTRVWSTHGWRQIGEYDGTANMTAASFLPGDAQVLVSAIDGSARIEDLHDPVLPDTGHAMWTAQLVDGGRRGLAAYSGFVDVLDASDPTWLRLVRRLTAPASAGAISGVVDATPDGSVAVAGTVTGALVAWRLRPDGSPVGVAQVVHPSTALIENLDVSADGRRVVATGDGGQIAVYDIVGGRLVPHATASLGALPLGLGAAISADGSLVAIGTGDKRVILYRVAGRTLRQVATIRSFQNYVYGVAFSPAGPLLAAGSNDKTVRLYDVSDAGHPRQVGPTLRDAGDSTNFLSFSTDGRLLAGSSNQHGVPVWRVGPRGGVLIARLHGADLGNTSVGFAPDGRHLLAGGSEGGLTLWPTDVDAAVRSICAVSGEPITKVEWREYVPGAAYDPPCR
ncbi:MAG: nSTAND1 domain-containing NTPase [Marmoricola sp.]